MKRVRRGWLDGLPVSLNSHNEVLQDIAQRIVERRSGGTISITNTESMYHALRRPAHKAYLLRADHSLCDGVGVIVAGWFWGLHIARYNGPILQLDCSERGQGPGWRHYFYGGKEGVADEMAHRLLQRFPDMQIVGTHCPPFRALGEAEDEAMVRAINDCRPDFVWVGLGLLKQEQWIAAHRERIHAPWMVGVGAAFDYHSGAVPWAPRVLRALGMEWVFRLVVQPRLRARRYWWSFVFVMQAAMKGLVQLRFARKPALRETE